MRILFASHSRRKVGGTEVYLDSVIPAFARTGHQIGFLYESDASSNYGPIQHGEDNWNAGGLGITRVAEALRQWKPDIIYAHGLQDAALEEAILALAPSVLYVHNYYGSCISGDKLHSTAVPHVCERPFGSACLFHYFPDHCGGRNPVTMWSMYRRQMRRQQLMSRYRALLTNSEHMVRELAKYRLRSECIFPFTGTTPTVTAIGAAYSDATIRLIFAGRMTSLKGGRYLLDAAPLVQRVLGRNVHVIFAGDGPDRAEWERVARQNHSNSLRFEFTGWLAPTDLQTAIAQSHLLVFPSIWPEPFGLSGPEAGLLGVPTVAFGVGGIPEWLNDGVNGHLAPIPPSPQALAEAISRALSNKEHYERLRAGAFREAQRYNLDDHTSRLMTMFERCVG